MREGRLILSGVNGAADRACEHEICNVFGGCTITSGHGHWRRPSDGAMIEDALRIVDIAYVPSAENDAKLYAIAVEYLHASGEDAVYCRYANGYIQLVDRKSDMDNGVGKFDLSFAGILNAVNVLADKSRPIDERVAAFGFIEAGLPDEEDKKS